MIAVLDTGFCVSRDSCSDIRMLQVFDPDSGQAKLYKMAIAPIVEEVLEGFNCTIFAYGQTGTGKTYTMEVSLPCSAAAAHSHEAALPVCLVRGETALAHAMAARVAGGGFSDSLLHVPDRWV